ncbi:cytochrome P450 family protein sad isoform X4 [Andrena cerasifolii]|uniref:cytochrome P450 family protein sad isoform X4 n=1 Tax=Andrena cerasifolii TaxID=2819439 RepID=UPI004037EA1D
MNVARNALKAARPSGLRGGVDQPKPYVPGCSYAGASRPPRIEDLSDISKPADGASRSKIEIAEKSRDRNYGTAATAATGSVLRVAPESRGLPVVGTLLAFLLSGGTKRQHEDGEEWIHFRKSLNKVMLGPDLTNLMAGPCQEAAVGLRRKWQKQIESNAIIPDLQIQLYQWSIEAMIATLMGSSWHSCKQQLSRNFDTLAKTLHKIFEYSAKLSIIPAKLAMNLRLPVWTKFMGCADTAFEIVRMLVPEMIRLGGDGLLRKMMDEGIREDDAIPIVTDFILAAGDTTATTLQWILLLMSKHPERQEMLLDHLKDLPQKEIFRNPLLKGMIKESLRLYPIAPFISRYLPEDSVIGNYFVPKEQLLVLSIYSSGRDSANFSQPNEFLPERWIRTEKGTYRGVLNPHASLPFALGARSCIGRKLAEIQISLALAELVKSFKIECVNRDRVDLILHLISVPSESMQLKLTQRNKA